MATSYKRQKLYCKKCEEDKFYRTFPASADEIKPYCVTCGLYLSYNPNPHISKIRFRVEYRLNAHANDMLEEDGAVIFIVVYVDARDEAEASRLGSTVISDNVLAHGLNFDMDNVIVEVND